MPESFFINHLIICSSTKICIYIENFKLLILGGVTIGLCKKIYYGLSSQWNYY